MLIQNLVLGDELLCGTGDKRGIGWLGRVMGRSHPNGPTITIPVVYPQLSLEKLMQDWEHDFNKRKNNKADNRVIFALGLSDVVAKTSSARARLYLASTLDRARQLHLSVNVIGPPPLYLPDTDPQLFSHYSQFDYACHEVCQRRGINYVSFAKALSEDETWKTDISAGKWVQAGFNYNYPGQTGYGMMAWLILHEGWEQWIGGYPTL